jgi:lipopolysaccharide export system protein LptC
MSARIKVIGLPIWSAQQWLLGAFFVASGLVAWWHLQPAPEEAEPEVERARLPDYVVTSFTAVETDDTGKPSRRLVAEELRQYVEEDVAELDRPRMTLYSDEGEPWRAQADSGLILPGGDEVQLRGSVELRRSGTRPNVRPTWRPRRFASGTNVPSRRPIRPCASQASKTG